MDLDSQKQSLKNSPVRLQKYLAACGLGARRSCEALIREGRVTVEGRASVKLGDRVDPAVDVVKVDGRTISPEPPVYILFNKPRDVICTCSDPRGRRTFKAFFDSIPERVYTVGRLDRDSEGLIIVTNDGLLANGLGHPGHEVHKTYIVTVSDELTQSALDRMEKGVASKGERLRAIKVSREGNLTYRFVLGEGRNRHIRRMLATMGVNVKSLKRIAIGDLKVDHLKCGEWRRLSAREVEHLFRMAGLDPAGTTGV